MATEINYQKTLVAVADRIEALKKDFPALKEFSASKNSNLENLSISYDFHTHPAERRAGWRSGVPDPDDDGLWLYLDFHDPDSTAQLHTQVHMPDLCLGRKIVFLLILEGKRTVSVAGAIREILKNNGVQPCEPIAAQSGKI